MKKKIVSLILVDGFRHDYVNPTDAPFLHQLARQNIDGIVRETFAFELRPAFFAGCQPEECGVAHMFYYNPKDSPFRDIDVQDGDRKRITRELRAEAERRGHSLVKFIGSCGEIPLTLLKYFDFSEKYYTSDRSSLGSYRTLFDYLRDDNKEWLWIAYPDGPGTTAGVLDEFSVKFSTAQDFIYLHFSELDWAGHEFGPHSEEQKKVLREIDEAIRKVYARLNQSFDAVQGIIFGDHGQVKIEKNVDIESLLRQSGLVLEKDYICFLDSTQARFWCLNDSTRKKIIDLLSRVPDGALLTEADLDRLHFRFSDHRFGQLVFVMNDETGIFPNYFQRDRAFKGLHGYLPEVTGNWAKLIITGCDVQEKFTTPIELVDLFPLLLEMLGYQPPANARPQPLFVSASKGRPKNRYKASVVMPTYNRLGILKESLQALENQTASLNDFEVVIVDDGSDDGTLQFLTDRRRATPLNLQCLSQAHSGPAAARNLGIMNSTGEITILLGDDMLPSPDLVSNHIQFHQKWSEVAHACLGFVDWAEDIEVNSLMKHVTSKEGGQQFDYDRVQMQDPDDVGWAAFWSGNISFKRLFALTHGRFAESIFKHAVLEDTELGYRLQKAGLVLHFRKEIRVNHKHEFTIDAFAERQRLVGWYSEDLGDLGVPMDQWWDDHEKDGLWSRTSLKDSVEAVRDLENQRDDVKLPILARVYNECLHHALMVGRAERMNRSQGHARGIIAHLHNLSLARQKIDCLAMENQTLRKENQRLQDENSRLQAFSDAVRQTFVYRFYNRIIKPLKAR